MQHRDTPLVRLDAVRVGFGARPVFVGLSFCLFPGRHLAVLGANGAGKSTLLRLIQGELRPAQDSPGRVFWNFTGSEETSPLVAREHVRLVSPALQRNYVRRGWNIAGEEILLSGLDNAVMAYGEMSASHYARAAKLAEEADASFLLGMPAPAMSQGQLRLALILRALMSDPALLLLDEPFDGLDGPARERIVRCMALAAQRGGTLLISAHRREDVPEFFAEALVLEAGRAEHLPLAAASGLLAAPAPGGAAALSPAPARCPARRGADSEFARALRARNAPVLQLARCDVFIDRKHVLAGINWTIRPGEQWIVSGRNGSGKSTLLRLLYGEEFVAYGGSMLWCGRERPGLEEFRGCVGYVSDRLQDRYDYDLSAEDVVVSGLRGSIGLYGEPASEERVLARDWLARMDLASVADQRFHSLSSGVARRVLLARALAASPPLLLLDEPCSGLDARSRGLLLRSLEQLAAQGVTLVYVSHHEADKSALFTHELRLEGGNVVWCGKRP